MKATARALFGFVASGLVAGCSGPPPKTADVGQFKGQVVLVWVGGSTEAGDGKFVFVPSPNQPLTFTRAASVGGRAIVPDMMYTDGGSVPRFGQVFRGLSPWNYGPVYVIHDWLFEARHCIVDKKANPKQAPLADMDFPESRDVLTEAIESLVRLGRVRRDDLSASAVSWAVGSPIARAAWEEQGFCDRNAVSAADRAAALAAIGTGAPVVGARRQARTVIATDGRRERLPATQIVAAISF